MLIHVLTCSSVLIWVVFNSFGCQSLLRLLWQNATDFMACCSVAQLCATLCDPMDCSMLGLPVLHCLLDLLKLMSIELVMPSHHLTLCCLLLLLPSVFLSIRVFFNESVFCTRWPKYWSFSFSISPSNEYSGLISFNIYWFDLLGVQGTKESSSTPQFKSISSLAPSLLYGPILTSIHDYWKKP